MRIYQIYPLGCCGAPSQSQSPFQQGAVPRLSQLQDWLEHLQWLGIEGVLLGPVFAASSHGYDTRDYFQVDPRLGNDLTLQALVTACHTRGMRVMLDAVFNHVGRDFWAFRDLRQHGPYSQYRNWFQRVNFRQRNRLGDPFSYQTWRGHHSLVKLRHSTPAVRQHLLQAAESWIQRYGIDGLRLDAADCLNLAFIRQLSRRMRRLRPDFFLLAEVVHGDYRRWLEAGFDAVTNYQLYHSLHTSHNANDYRLLAQTLQQQWGPNGHYRGRLLNNFADNHDVSRIASLLRTPAQLYPLYILLFSLPGHPSLYYGSEWGQLGKKRPRSDAELRPAIPHPFHWQPKPHPDLQQHIRQLARLQSQWAVLQTGDWQLLQADRETLFYLRRMGQQRCVVGVNLSDQPQTRQLHLAGYWQDPLNQELLRDPQYLTLYPHWGRILLG